MSRDINRIQEIKMKKRIVIASFITAAALVGCTSDMSRQSESDVRQSDLKKLSEKNDRREIQRRDQSEAVRPELKIFEDRARAQAGVSAQASESVQTAPAAKHFNMAPPRPISSSVMVRPAPADRENYAVIKDSGIKRVSDSPVSTFSIDVDTGAYANVRRFLDQGALPPQDAVRVEELINYFDYGYPNAVGGEHPFAVATEIARTPWNEDTLLLRVGIKGENKDADEDVPANLVFLVDVSGSMNQTNKLPLVKKSLLMLTQHLDRADRVSIVVYAGSSGIALEPTPGDQHQTIASAIRSLRAGGGTNGADGIRTAYRLAQEHFVSDGVNRVILTTDGDFNVGTTSFDELKKLVEKKRTSGVYLTTLGFGQGNYNDHLMEQLADSGNGNYGYIDSIHEARKVLVEEMQSTLYTIAKDVKIQIEFNPDQVDEYRLIGYENRALAREDFNDDRVDAGEIGAGHTVTALYEVALKGAGSRNVDQLRYQTESKSDVASSKDAAEFENELAFVKLRYKRPQSKVSTLIEQPVSVKDVSESASVDMRFASAVAGFGQLLRGGQFLEEFEYDDVVRIARDARGVDTHGYRAQFIELVQAAKVLTAISNGHSGPGVAPESRRIEKNVQRPMKNNNG